MENISSCDPDPVPINKKVYGLLKFLRHFIVFTQRFFLSRATP